MSPGTASRVADLPRLIRICAAGGNGIICSEAQGLSLKYLVLCRNKRQKFKVQGLKCKFKVQSSKFKVKKQKTKDKKKFKVKKQSSKSKDKR
jgi:hypothetical protein